MNLNEPEELHKLSGRNKECVSGDQNQGTHLFVPPGSREADCSMPP